MVRTLLATLASLFCFASLTFASFQEEEGRFLDTGNAAVDAAVESYEQALANWEEASAEEKADFDEARTDAKAAATAAIDSAIEGAEQGSEEAAELERLRFQVTGDARDAAAVLSEGLDIIERAKNWLLDNWMAIVIKLVVILVIYVVFKILAGIAGKVVKRGLATPKIKASNLLKDFIVGIVQKFVMAIGILVILTQLGVDVAPILAGLGVAGFVLGFALQDTLGNFAAGLMILFYRPYDVGDFVTAGGVSGTVDAMSLVSTTIKTPDNQTLIVPNGSIWGGVIQNVTANPTRRVDLVFGIGYDDDMAKAESILRRVVEGHEKVLAEPAVNIRVHELADSSVNFVVRPWTKTSDYWDVYWDLTRQVKEAFDAEGVSIPFPQRDVHLHTVESQD